VTERVHEIRQSAIRGVIRDVFGHHRILRSPARTVRYAAVSGLACLTLVSGIPEGGNQVPNPLSFGRIVP